MTYLRLSSITVRRVLSGGIFCNPRKGKHIQTNRVNV